MRYGTGAGRTRWAVAALAAMAAMSVAACGAGPGHAVAQGTSLKALLGMKPRPSEVRLLPGDPPHLAALGFETPEDGWAGGQGVILATRDGGRTWRPQYLGRGNVSGFSILSRNVAFAATSVGLLGTEDGQTWQRISAQPLSQIQFLTPSQGYGLGHPASASDPSSFSLLATTDGGRVWQRLPIGPVEQACFFAGGVGLAVPTTPYFGGGLTVRRTSDGGQTWSTVFSVPAAHAASLACTADGGAWLVAAGGAGMSQQSYSVFRSGDQGATWTAALAVSTAGAGPAPGDTRGAATGPGSSPGPIAALGKNQAVMTGLCEACTGSGIATVATTRDGGVQWRTTSAEPPVSAPDVLALAALTPADMWLLFNVGSGQSEIAATTDGGAAWRILYTAPRSLPPFSLTYATPTVAFGFGTSAYSLSFERSDDGGRNWRTVGQLPKGTNPYNYSPIAAVGTRDLYVVASGVLLRSSDGGRHWQVVRKAISGNVHGLKFTTPQTGCYSVIGAGQSRSDFETRDGGKTWRKAALQGVPASVCAVAARHPALASEAAGLIRRLTAPTGNAAVLPDYLSLAGATESCIWLAFSNDPGSRLYILSANRPPAVTAWPDQEINPAALVPFGDREAYLLTTDGRLLRTTDQGRTWTQES